MSNENEIFGQLENCFNDVNCVAMELELKDGEIINVAPKMLSTRQFSGIDSYGFRVTFLLNSIKEVKPLYQTFEPEHMIM